MSRARERGCGSAGRCATRAAAGCRCSRSALLLALGVGMYSAMSSMSVWRDGVGRRELRRAADARPARLARAGQHVAPRARCARRWRSDADRGAWRPRQERLVVPTQVDASHGAADASSSRAGSSARRPAAPSTARDRARARAAPADDGRPVVELERNFAKHYGLPRGGHVTARRRRGAVRYVGPGARARVLHRHRAGRGLRRRGELRRRVRAAARRAQALAGERGRVNELVAARCGPAPTPAAVAGRARPRAAAGAARAPAFTFTAGGQEPAHRLIYKDAEGDQQMMDIFAVAAARSRGVRRVQPRSAARSRRSGARSGSGWRSACAPRALARRPLLLGAQVALAGRRARHPGRTRRRRVAAPGDAAFFPLHDREDANGE